MHNCGTVAIRVHSFIFGGVLVIYFGKKFPLPLAKKKKRVTWEVVGSQRSGTVLKIFFVNNYLGEEDNIPNAG